MVQIIRGGSEQNEANERIGFKMGKNLSDTLMNYSSNRALDKVLNDPTLKDAPTSVKLGRLEEALRPYGQKGQETLANRMKIEMEAKQEAENRSITKALTGKQMSEDELSNISPQNQMKIRETLQKKQFAKNVKQSLLNAGYSEETADLWQRQVENSPVGGQTDVIKAVNDLIKRSQVGKGAESINKQEELKPTIEIPGLEGQSYSLDFPDIPEPVGLTPADVVRQNEHREKTNIPVYTTTVDRLNALDDEYREIQHLQELNEDPDVLPSGIAKWNVNWETGDLRVKALATPEAQDYAKTIARMARRAKDFFPGRVTNFDLDIFKQGFPTLANSAEGRKVIAEQLSLGNRIAYLKDETLKAAYDHYGSGADPILVKKYATENYRRIKKDLEDKLNDANKRAERIISESPEGEESQESRPSLAEIFG